MEREEFEYLGWKYNEDDDRYELNCSNVLTYRYFYLYHRPGNKIYKSIVTIYENGINKRSDVRVWRMEIKDILELKWLLKRLNIDVKIK